jgi:F-type H+-transporting ATPase subunit delta
MKNELIIILESLIELNRVSDVVKKLHEYLAILFGTLADIITQTFFFLIKVVPFVVVLGILCLLIWRFVKFAWQLFDNLDQTLSKDDTVKKAVDQQVAIKEEAKLKNEKANLQVKLKQLDDNKNYYQIQSEQLQQLVDQLEKEKNYYKNSTSENTVQPTIVKVPDKELAEALYKSDLKQQIRQVIAAADDMDAADIYQRAIASFTQEIFLLQIRYALPYKIILRLFELYSEAELKNFYRSFHTLIDTLSVRKYRKIYKSTYYSPEEKITLFADLGVLETLDDEFGQFLYFLLKNYSFHQVRELYQHFQKVWGIKFYQGTITVSLASEAEIDCFQQLWNETGSYYHLEYDIQGEIKKGVIIQSAQLTVDLSYQKLIDQFIEQQEMEVSL